MNDGGGGSGTAMLDVKLLQELVVWFLRKCVVNKEVLLAEDGHILRAYTDAGLYNRELIHFDNIEIQTAYILRFYVSHTYNLKQVLVASRAVQALLSPNNNNNAINLCSIGAGPGCDVMALALSLATCSSHTPPWSKQVPKVDATCFDIFPQWRHSAEQLINLAQRALSIGDVEYRKLDLLHYADAVAALPEIRSANIIMMCKVISAVVNLERWGCARRNIELMLKNAPVGVILVFVDNSGGGSTEAVQQILWEQGGWQQMYAFRNRVHMPQLPNKDLHYLRQDIKIGLQQKSKISAFVYQKASAEIPVSTPSKPSGLLCEMPKGRFF